jgi:ABC-2 type transport system ATP-binding protein
VIELSGIRMRLGGRAVLDGVDLMMRDGESCRVAGANGSGRTTLLRVCAGLLRPASGSVRVGGVDAGRSTRELRRRVGYVPQRAGAVPELTVREELEFAATCHGIAPARRRGIVADLLGLSGLDGRADSEVGSLSPGLLRRLVLARALVHDPAVLLLDNPDAGLDEAGVTELAELIVELRTMGKTLLVVASPSLLAEVCDSTVDLEDGRLRRRRGGELASALPA